MAAIVAARFGENTVRHILRKYGVDYIEELSPNCFSEVFNELDFMASEDFD